MMKSNFRVDKTSIGSLRKNDLDQEKSYLTQKLQTLSEGIEEMGHRFEKQPHPETLSKELYKEFIRTLMEERDQQVRVDPPVLSENQTERANQIKQWLADVTKHVFSISFNYFQKEVFRTQTTKAFCSESFINNIIALSKVNKVSSADMKLINEHLAKNLLPYYLLRYPQSENKEVNLSLAKEVETINTIDSNENNLIIKSKISFKYKESGDYSEEIMRFFNYLISVPTLKADEDNTMFESFHKNMETIFKSVYDRHWV